MSAKSQYEQLIRDLVPRFPAKCESRFKNFCRRKIAKISSLFPTLAGQSHHAQPKLNNKPIVTVDLSSDEAENDHPIVKPIFQPFQRSNYQSMPHRSDFKKPSIAPFVDLSDDDDDDLQFTGRTLGFSSTLVRGKKLPSPMSSNSKSNSSSTIVPSVNPVNSLQERQNSKSCLKDDCIQSIIRKFNDSKIRHESLISVELLK